MISFLVQSLRAQSLTNSGRSGPAERSSGQVRRSILPIPMDSPTSTAAGPGMRLMEKQNRLRVQKSKIRGRKLRSGGPPFLIRANITVTNIKPINGDGLSRILHQK